MSEEWKAPGVSRDGAQSREPRAGARWNLEWHCQMVQGAGHADKAAKSDPFPKLTQRAASTWVSTRKWTADSETQAPVECLQHLEGGERVDLAPLPAGPRASLQCGSHTSCRWTELRASVSGS